MGAVALSPRKRPVQPRAQATVEVILTAAAQLLERDGLARFTTNAVAARAGVSIGSVYQYFPSKEALTAVLIERSLAELERSLTQAGNDARRMPFEAGLRKLVRAAIQHQLARPALERTLDFEERRLPLADAAAERIQATIVAFLKQHQGQLWVSNLSAAAHDMQATMRALIDAAAERGERSADAIEQRIVRALRGYLLR
jgi:AcrR family transcriptional regulator